MNNHFIFALLCLIMSKLSSLEDDTRPSTWAKVMMLLWFLSCVAWLISGIAQ